MNATVAQLKQRGLVWQASAQTPETTENALPFPGLDEHLPKPVMAHRLIEIQSPIGVGELRLLLPVLATQLQQTQCRAIFITPPHPVCADAVAGYGLDLGQIWCIPADHAQSGPWAAEECLKSGCCLAVIAWLPELTSVQTKRLVLAARQGQSHLFLFRRPQQPPLGHGLCMELSSRGMGLQVNIKKTLGGWPPKPFEVSPEQLWPPSEWPGLQAG